ncbi:hypothetical protein Trco_000692 [Trichoderma cornu-damae]|uniref:NACHT domain-containing protein n=1 Tax=Trichoderma cornu-damae TaxID=654480 RepID=A0A9P8U029_9HYPO|nr:hypothetical protein Trco_000692 [Trichoderma cornu-damae]
MASLATGSAPTQASASQLITEAVGRFKQAASAQDQIEIQNTQVDDVIKALRVIQEGLQKKRQNRNLVKLYRFVQGLQKYTEAIEVLSNGLSPYLPWIWIASDHMVAFDKLIEAYDKIAETLPRLDQLSNAFKDNSTLLAKLALYYADVLEFHRRAYKFVRRRSWKFFFATTWANFDVRFDSILASLAHHSDLIVQEAHVFDIVEAKKWREKMDKQTAAMESEKLYRQRTSVIAWLGLDRPMQDDEGERLLRDCVPDSCDWILKNKTVESWLRPDNKDAVVWLHGKPGAGKSVICANLLESLQQQCFTTLSYFCKYRENISALAILKTFVLSLVNESPDLTAIAFANYVEKYAKISSKLLRTMLVGSPEKPGLLQGVPVCRIVVDGLDECELPEQKVIINALIQLISPGSCKLLICSRDVPEIRRALQRNSRRLATISLSNESALVNNTIHAFAKSKIEELMDDKPMLRDDSDMSDELIQIIVDKSDGMFLWAKLVLDLARDVDNLLELHDTLTTTPQELSKLYDQILGLLCKGQPEKRIERIMRTLAWITLAKRPLKPHEILHGVTVTPETPIVNKWNKLDDVVIDRCKPLIEELPNGSIALIHFTLQEYFSAKFEQSISSWHNSIAFSCATTINAGLLLVDPRYSEKDRLLHVVNGLLCLLPYSVDFWFDHLLDYATTNVDLIAEDSPLGKEVAGFYSSHHRIVRETGKQLPPAIRSQSPTADARVSKISHLPINALCLSLITFRKECGANLPGTGEEIRT